MVDLKLFGNCFAKEIVLILYIEINTKYLTNLNRKHMEEIVKFKDTYCYHQIA